MPPALSGARPSKTPALVLSGLVDQGQLSDETADRLWLALVGRAQAGRSASHALTV